MSPNSLLVFLAIGLPSTLPIIAQMPATSPNDAVRVTVTLNADGSRTIYQFDNAKHEGIAATTDANGKPRGKIVYQIGDAGRFISGIVFGPDGRFLFKSTYKYDAAGRLEEETHLGKDDAVINKIVYKYDAKGKQIGYSVFDPTGKLLSGVASPTSTASSKPRDALAK